MLPSLGSGLLSALRTLLDTVSMNLSQIFTTAVSLWLIIFLASRSLCCRSNSISARTARLRGKTVSGQWSPELRLIPSCERRESCSLSPRQPLATRLWLNLDTEMDNSSNTLSEICRQQNWTETRMMKQALTRCIDGFSHAYWYNKYGTAHCVL